MKKELFCIGGSCKVIEKVEDGEEKFFLEILASTADIDLEEEIISGDALKGARHDLLKNNTVLLGHDRDVIIGSTVESEFISPKQLKLKILILNSRPDIQEMIRKNALNKASIGGRMLNWKEEIINGKKIRIITRIRLHEVSLVSLPANQQARSLRWWIDKDDLGEILVLGLVDSQEKEGDTEKMTTENLNPNGGEPTGEEVIGFEFDPAEVEEVGKEVQADAKAMEIREKMLHITGRIKAEATDEGIAKAAAYLEDLIGQISISAAKSEAELTGKRFDAIEILLKQISEKGITTKEAPADGKPSGGKPKVVRRKSAGPAGSQVIELAEEGETPADNDGDPDAAIKAELKNAKTRGQKFAILRKHKRLTIPASAA